MYIFELLGMVLIFAGFKICVRRVKPRQFFTGFMEHGFVGNRVSPVN